jgi:pyruvate-formate lyase-activating enzyme
MLDLLTPNGPHTVLVHKATRGPKITHSALTLSEAMAQADQLYEASKLLANAGVLASGVSVLVARQDQAERLVAQGCLYPADHKSVLFQFGSF